MSTAELHTNKYTYPLYVQLKELKGKRYHNLKQYIPCEDKITKI